MSDLTPLDAARRILRWAEEGRLVDDESLVQELAPVVASAFLAQREQISALISESTDILSPATAGKLVLRVMLLGEPP